MEKKVLAIIFLIGLIIYTFVQVLPFIIGFCVLAGLIFLIKRLYNRNPKGYASVGSILLAPLLLLGWVYIGFLAYTNLYCHIYILTGEFEGTEIFAGKTFLAKNDEEAIVKAWKYSTIQGDIETIDDEYFYYLPKKRIYNWTTDEVVDIHTYKNTTDSLYYKYGERKIKPDDLFW
jgi:predicted membrane protein